MASGTAEGRWSKAGSRLRGVLAVALTVVGLARIVGFYTGVFPLSVLGAQFGASPLPLVFSQVRGVETYSRRFAVELVSRDGSRTLIPGDQTLVRRLHGPFTRIKTYIDELAFTDLSPVSRRQALLEHAFCDAGPMLQALQLGPPDAIIVHVWDALDRPATERRFEVRCVE